MVKKEKIASLLGFVRQIPPLIKSEGNFCTLRFEKFRILNLNPGILSEIKNCYGEEAKQGNFLYDQRQT
jgi:hypothetical protein